MINYTVRAQWDEQAKVWVTDGEDILGLCVEAASFDQLFEIILAAPELLRGNTAPPAGTQIRITLVAERRATTIITV